MDKKLNIDCNVIDLKQNAVVDNCIGLNPDQVLLDGNPVELDDLDHIVVHQRVVTLLPDSLPAQASSHSSLSEAERHRMLIDWNSTQKDYPLDLCLHQLFEAQVERTPDAIALVYEQESLTYHQLNQRANQLAHHLRSLGVGPEILVGICLERSLEMVIGLLGILKAGGAYVPLDPAYPADRLGFMIDDAAAPVLLTQERFLLKLQSTQATVLCLDRDWPDIAIHSTINPVSGVTSSNLVYTIYTSGSTGRPKGVMNLHSSLVNFISWMTDEYGFTPQDRILQKTTFSFDASGREFYPPLISGGTLVMARPGGHMDPDYLVEAIHTYGITIINFVPSMLTAFLEAERVETCTSLRRVICGGEALPATTRDRFHSLLGANLHNLYGPTEAAIDVTYWHCEREDTDPVVPIGRPIANTQVYVLDEESRLVPIGTPGELYLGGVNLARGYLNRPELTAEKFVHLTLEDGIERRLYRTGDLARWRVDGTLEHLGRLDHQVKIRGFRIELGEIEAVLAGHSDVVAAAAVAHEFAPGDVRLVAYVELKDHQRRGDELEAALKTLAREQLPAHMVPNPIVLMEAFPHTLNGKLDRKALPVPILTTEVADENYIAPRSPIEETLAFLWSDVLGIPQIGIHHNFFELGGHSLLAMRIITRIRSALQVRLSLKALFDLPTIAQLAGEIESQRAESGYPETAQEQVSEPLPEDLPLTISPMQQWLGYAWWKDPDSPNYNIPHLFHLKGNLDVAALREALQALVERHEALRSTFRFEEEVLSVALHPDARIELPGCDFESREETGQLRHQILEQVDAEAQRPFDLSKELPFRAHLWRADEQEHWLLLNVHHIVFDGWSWSVLTSELSALYAQYATSLSDLPDLSDSPNLLVRLPSSSELSVRYRTHLLSRQKIRETPQYQRDLDYWEQRLAGAPAMLDLPTDRPRKDVGGTAGDRVEIALSADLTSQLDRVSRNAGASLYMTLLAAWQTVLARYSNQTDFVIYSPVAQRSDSEEPLIGCLLNMMAIRSDFRGSPTFTELLGRMRQSLLADQEHLDASIIDIRSLPRTQILFTYQNMPATDLVLKGIEVSEQSLRTKSTKSELTLILENDSTRIRGEIIYYTDLFDRASIERMAGHFQTLLERAVQTPDTPLQQFSLLAETERQQLLVAWNATQTDYPRNLCAHPLFEAQAERSPDAIALVCEQEALTYRQLNQRANRLAHHLQSLGVGPETLVGLCLERSLGMVVAMLAILKAGGAYVPLDPGYPAERTASMLADTHAPLLITSNALKARLTDSIPAQTTLLCLDNTTEAADLWSDYPDTDPPCRTNADCLAYVMYTSGSTGKPKGVMVPHRGIVRLVQNTDYVTFSPNEVFLQLAPVAFDAATFEMWGALLNGGKLVLYPGEIGSPQALGDCIQQQGITTLWLTAGLFHLMVAEAVETLRGVRQLLAGGDVISPASARCFLEQAPGSLLINGYGPTENTTFTCCHRMTCPQEVETPVPIGRPIANTQVYVLDEQLQPVPIGVEGELYAGGDGLALGYWNQPDLTRERFVPHPFDARADARLYRTGDRVRWRADGTVEFLGRRDNQVKIRGFRIELGEVEAVLSGHPDVVAVVAVAHAFAPGDVRLVAYVEGKWEGQIPVNLETELKALAREKLPAYMVPAFIIPIQTWPLTSNGKLDRKALPAPTLSGKPIEVRYVAPTSPIEEILVSLWSEVLGVPQIGIRDDFFELGGHSLLAIRLLSRVQRSFDVRLSLAAVLKAPTIQAMAALLASRMPGSAEALAEQGNDEGSARAPDGWSSVVPLQTRGDLLPLFCAPVGGGSPFFYRALAARLAPHRPVYALEPRGLSGIWPPHETVEEMAAFYIQEIRTIQRQGPYHLAGLSFGGVVAFEMARQLTEIGETVGCLLLLDTWSPDLARYFNSSDVTPRIFSLWRRKLDGVKYAYQLHRENLKVLDLPRERTRYLREVLARFGANLVNRLRGRPWRWATLSPTYKNFPELYSRQLAAEASALNSYRPLPFQGKIWLLSARVRRPGSSTDPYMGWQGLATGGIEVIKAPGTHFSLIEEPCVRVTATIIGEVLNR